MATIDNATRGMFGDLDPKRDPREQIADEQIRATLPEALTTAGDVLGVLSLLPQAFSRAQRDELARLERSDREPKQSPRIAGLRASIARADTLRTTSTHGEARFSRFVAALDETSQILHGFVSDRALNPLAGHRVEVSVENPNGEKSQTLAATTAEDGYFRIVLNEKGIVDGSTRDRVSATVSRILGGKIDAKNAAFKATAAAEAAANSRLGKLVVKSPRGEVLYEDPVPAELDTGDVYREYVVGATGKDTVPPPPRTVPGTPDNPRGRVDPKDAKAAADVTARAEAEAKAEAAAMARAEADARTKAAAKAKSEADAKARAKSELGTKLPNTRALTTTAASKTSAQKAVPTKTAAKPKPTDKPRRGK